MSTVVELTSELIARASITPDDAGCQTLLAERLTAAGFTCEHLRLDDVDNLWATHGNDDPVLMLLGHTDVVPRPARAKRGTATRSRPTSAMACCTGAARRT